MNYLRLLFCFLPLIGMCISCSKDEVNPGTEPGKDKEVINTTLILTDTCPFTRSGGSTIKEDEGKEFERTIKTLEFYIFDEEGKRDEHEDGYKKITVTDNKAEHTIPVTAGSRQFFVAVNMDLGKLSGKNLNEVRTTLCNKELNNTNSQQNESNRMPFPMSGESELVEIKKGSTNNKVTIEISRLFSKLNSLEATGATVKLSKEELKEVFGEGTIEKVSFSLESYYVINGLNKSYAFRNYNSENDEEKPWDHANCWKILSEGGTYFNSQYAGDSQKQPQHVYSGTIGEGAQQTYWLKETPVYVYENSPKPEKIDGDVEGFKKTGVYAMILKGKLKATVKNEGGAEEEKEETRYWRMNLNSGKHNKILRNVVYDFVISKVNTIGYGNERDAEDDDDNGPYVPAEGEAAIEAKVDIKKWRVFKVEEEI